MVKPYCIGSKEWNGLGKVIEECGELLQVCGKVLCNEGENVYWGDVDLKDKFVEEIADVYAALEFFVEKNNLDPEVIRRRAGMKFTKFLKWDRQPEIYAGYSKDIKIIEVDDSKTMDIYSRPGTQVVYTGKNGYDSDLAFANRFLEVDRCYTVDKVDVGNWYSYVMLSEFPGKWFNTVHFKEWVDK